MGPSYSTKREEAREGIQTLMQALGPQSAPLLADLFVQGQDFPLADRIAKRMRLLLPPNVAEAGGRAVGRAAAAATAAAAAAARGADQAGGTAAGATGAAGQGRDREDVAGGRADQDADRDAPWPRPSCRRRSSPTRASSWITPPRCAKPKRSTLPRCSRPKPQHAARMEQTETAAAAKMQQTEASARRQDGAAARQARAGRRGWLTASTPISAQLEEEYERPPAHSQF